MTLHNTADSLSKAKRVILPDRSYIRWRECERSSREPEPDRCDRASSEAASTWSRPTAPRCRNRHPRPKYFPRESFKQKAVTCNSSMTI